MSGEEIIKINFIDLEVMNLCSGQLLYLNSSYHAKSCLNFKSL
jgi:hypothetical protein